MDVDFFNEFNSIIKKQDEYGEKYSKAKALSWFLQEMTSVIKSDILKEYPDLSIARAEVEAKTSQRYKDHLKITRDAIEDELHFKYKCEVAKSEFEKTRSLSSLEKVSRNMICE